MVTTDPAIRSVRDRAFCLSDEHTRQLNENGIGARRPTDGSSSVARGVAVPQMADIGRAMTEG